MTNQSVTYQLFSPIRHSSELLKHNASIVIPMLNCRYSNVTTANDVFCFFVYLDKARDVSVKHFLGFGVYAITACLFYFINQTIIEAVFYFDNTISWFE